MYTKGTVSVRTIMCLSLSAVLLLLTMVLTLLEVFILDHCDPPSTGRIGHEPQMAQTGAIELLKLLNKYLLTVTYEYGENYSIRFENGPLFYSIQNEKNTIWTALILMPNDQQISLRMQY